MTDLSIALRLFLESRQFTNGLRTGSRDLGDFSSRGRRQIGAINDAAVSLRNNLAKAGIGLGVLATLKQSGSLDKYLARIGQTADATRGQVEGLRREVFQLSRDTGRSVEGIAGGFDTLIQKGLDYRSSLASIRAITPASAVTGADESVLAEALFVGGTAFGFDLNKTGQANELLDQMYVAAKSGSAELEQLATIFGVSGGKAKDAGLQFKQALSLVEVLSLTSPKERLGNLFDSTLRLFTNGQYIKNAEKGTGVPFFDKAGNRRDPSAVLADFAKKYQSLTTAKGRQAFITKAVGQADLDTQTGLIKLISDGELAKFDNILKRTDAASGIIARNLSGAIDNPIDQAARMTAAMREAGEAFARPVNRTITDIIQFQLDDPSKGGLGLGPLGAVAATGGLLVAAGTIGKVAGGLLKKIPIFGGAAADAANTAAGLAQGQMVKEAGLATPVFVTNFPASLGSGSSGAGVIEGAVAALAGKGLLARFGLTTAAGVGSAALGTAGVLAAGAAGFEAGGAIYRNFFEGNEFGDQIGRAVATALAAFGNDEARDAIDRRNGKLPLVKVEIDATGGVRLKKATATGGAEVDFSSGPLRLGAGE